MRKLCRVDLERSEKIFEGIEKYKAHLIKKLHPSKIILFGSFASGDFNEGSDVDLIVVADWQVDFLDRIKLLLELNKFKLPLEPIGYTGEEYTRLQEEQNGFIMEVMDTGKIIYDDSK